MILNLITPPSEEPLTLEEVEGQVRLPGQLADEAEFAQGLISAVRELAESVTKRALITQTWEMILDDFPNGREEIVIPLPPLQTINSIIYIDNQGNVQTMDALDYRVVLNKSGYSYVMPVYGKYWPNTLNDIAVIKVNFVCGYGPIDPSTELNIPKPILQWMKINFANLFENRESVVIEASRAVLMDTTPMIADGLIANYRMVRL